MARLPGASGERLLHGYYGQSADTAHRNRLEGCEDGGHFCLTVTKNHEPVLSAPLADAAGQAGEDFSYVLAAWAFSNPDGDALSYSASLADGSALPSWLSFDAASRPFRRRLDALYEAESKRQAMLVETIHGIATVKAMAIEPLLRGQWEQKVAAAVSMQFRVGRISITARSLTQFLERMMTVILIWVGAGLVFDGSLSVGALIAFQMLAGRVTSPLVRLVGLIHQYQEAALSVEKLGVVMNAREEWGADRHGAIQLAGGFADDYPEQCLPHAA